ncbi:MAG: S8 family serine peptidase [Thermoleophilia bacterium]
MARRRTALLTLAAAAAATATAVAATPAGDPPGHLGHPRSAAPAASGEVTVILQLAGPPVAVGRVAAQRGARARTWSTTRFRAGVIARQRRLVPGVRAAGGTVVATYRDAYNGVAVRIPADRVARLRDLPGVVAVHRSRTVRRLLTSAVPFTGVPGVGGRRVTGRGVRIGIIDTGVDFHHADLGGSGDPADFAADAGTDPVASGFPTAKVTGGYDFVGDSYGTDDPAGATPQPDPVPLDCDGHGTHVAGIAAGTGVRADGAAYAGPYTARTLAGQAFRVGPGVAPEATISAYRVFGCTGNTEDAILIAAIDRAVRDRVDVINMSIGTVYTGGDDPVAAAVDAATRAGVVVVGAAGNEGPGPYTGGSPAAADGAIAAGAADTIPDFPAATVEGTALAATAAQETTGTPIPAGLQGPLAVTGTPAMPAAGCDPADYADRPAGAIPVVLLGVCTHTAKALLAQAVGAPAVILVSNDPGYGTQDGPLPGVTIPVLVVPVDALPALRAADGTTVSVTAAPRLVNPFFRRAEVWSSAGPRWDDSALKPDLLAPGVSIASAASGTGTGAKAWSGTSMAAPYAAGVAALVRQARPGWGPADVKAAMMSTASGAPGDLADDDVLTSGAGLVRPVRAVGATVRAMTSDGLGNLSYGFVPANGPISQTRRVRLVNDGSRPVTYALAATPQGDLHGARLSLSDTRVTVPARGSAQVALTVSLGGAAVAGLPGADGTLTTVRGVVAATPVTDRPGVHPLRIPFLMVPAARSAVATGTVRLRTLAGGRRRVTVPVENSGVHGTRAGVFAWGLADPAGDAADTTDIRTAGVRVVAGSDPSLEFAITLDRGLSNPARTEFDVTVDVGGDGTPDLTLVGVDSGYADIGDQNGRMQAFVLDASGTVVDRLDATAPPNSATVLLPLPLRHLGPLDETTEIIYSVSTYDTAITDAEGDTTGIARFRPLAPAVETGALIPLAPGQDRTLTLSAGPRSAAAPLGWLLVALDDPAGIGQANPVPMPRR